MTRKAEPSPLPSEYWPHDYELWFVWCKCKSCESQGKYAMKRMWEIHRWIYIKFKGIHAEAPECRECANERRAAMRRREALARGHKMRPYEPFKPSARPKQKYFRVHWYSEKPTVQSYMLDKPCKCEACKKTKKVSDFSPSMVREGVFLSDFRKAQEEGKTLAARFYKGRHCKECARDARRARGRKKYAPIEYAQPLTDRAGCLACKAAGTPRTQTVADMAKVGLNKVYQAPSGVWVFPYCRECFNTKSRAGIASATP